MPRSKRRMYTDSEIREAYDLSGSLSGMAQRLNISYPTAAKWASDLRINLKRQGYSKPQLSITGAQCRIAREFLGLSRETFCNEARISKTSLREFELGNSTLRKSNFDKVANLFKKYGVKLQD